MRGRSKGIVHNSFIHQATKRPVMCDHEHDHMMCNHEHDHLRRVFTNTLSLVVLVGVANWLSALGSLSPRP